MARPSGSQVPYWLLAVAALFPSSLCRAQSSGSPPAIKSGGVVSASAFGQFTSIAPGSWIEIYGSNLAADSRSWTVSDFTGVNAPTSLDGTTVTIGGQQAFIDYVSPAQVNAQVPSTVGGGPQQVIVTTAAGVSLPYTITVNVQQPGLLAPPSFNVSGKQYVAALFSDGVTYVLPPGTIAGLPSRRALPGDVVTVYGVGFGAVAPNIPAGQIAQQSNSLVAPFLLWFGPAAATFLYDGLAPSTVGLYQFNVVVPNVAASDSVPLTFTLGGMAGTQTLYIAVQGAGVSPQLQSLSLSASQVSGGGPVQGTILLSSAALAGGAAVALSSNSTAVSVPATVTVPAGSTSATFPVSTLTVTATQTATITAVYNGTSAHASLSVTAPASLPFLQLSAVVTYQPVGYPSAALGIIVTPDAGNTTYTATIGPVTWISGVATNQGLTFTFNTLDPGYNMYPIGTSTVLVLSSSTLSFTLTPPALLGVLGNLNGTLTMTGTPLTGGAASTLSGAVTGTYVETAQF